MTNPASADATWAGRSGRLGYVAKMFPRISETFILDEILALQRSGVPVRIYSVLPPVRDGRVHPEALELLPEVEVLSPERPRSLFLTARELADCFRIRPIRAAVYLARALFSTNPARRLRRLREVAHLASCLRRDRIAHVHAAWAHTPASVVRMACRLTGIPWSMSAHAKDIHLSDQRGLAQKVAAARFTVACTASHRDLLARLETEEPDGVRRSKVSLAHHGVDASYFSPAAADGAATRVPIVLSVGRMVPKKGFTVLLEAAARLQQRGLAFRVEIVGGGPDRGPLERLVASLGIGARVTLTGMAVREEIRAAYRRASCFVLASRVADDGDRDGIPNTLAEAMACGLPVVASRLPGIEEIVRDGETGVLVPPDDPTALAGAIEDLIADPERARRLGARARKWVQEHFDSRALGNRRAHRLGKALGIERVLVVSADRGVPVRGHKGASVHVRSVVAALERAGVETRILTTRPGPVDGPAPAAPLLEARSGALSRGLARTLKAIPGGGEALERAVLRVTDNLPLHFLGRRLAANWKPDLVYERYALTAVAGALLARHLRVPFVLEVNAPLAEEERVFRGLRLGFLARRIEAWLLRRADRVVVVSEALEEWAVRLGAPRERVLVLPNAVDPETFGSTDGATAVRERHGLAGDFVVGFCGSLKPWHGVARLLDASASARTAVPNLGVLIVGDGPERAALERRAMDLGMADRVHFAGSIPHAEVPRHLAACDVLAAPYEPMEQFYFSPLKLQEYLQIGRPVLISALGGIPRLVHDAPHVTLLPPGNNDALAAAIVSRAFDTPSSRRAATAPRAAWTWREVVVRVLEAGEQVRRERWGWTDSGAPAPSLEHAIPRSAAPAGSGSPPPALPPGADLVSGGARR